MMHTPSAIKREIPKVETAAEVKTKIVYVDPFEEPRKAPVGSKYSVAPENFKRRDLADAIKLGYEYKGINDKGRIMLEKTKESPTVNVPEVKQLESNAWLDAANLPRTIMASEDLSAPLRQGLGLIHKKAFWKALPDMVRAFGSEDFYKSAQQAIIDDPIFQKGVNAQGKVLPSFAEASGLKLTDLGNMATREESMLSKTAEKIPGVRPSNRAYTLFLNKLRADSF